ncbi:MAG: hypothetical protein DRH70_02555 [Candidatus Coatesbacteria bacterium]|nr:MAG: hypothetical protein DRH70_02555 [Candidatus Coatesbacteria bacterium]
MFLIFTDVDAFQLWLALSWEDSWKALLVSQARLLHRLARCLLQQKGAMIGVTGCSRLDVLNLGSQWANEYWLDFV